MFVLDPDGTLVYYNEPAEELAGKPFARLGEIKVREWGASFSPENVDGSPLELDTLPPGVALLKREAAHDTFRITVPGGTKRTIAITAFPLFARHDEFVGALAIFWPTNGAAPNQ